MAAVDLLDAGWRPGTAELDCARFVDNWAILPLKDGSPYFMIGESWTLPISHTLFVTRVFALDHAARWARTLDEWVVIGEPVDIAEAARACDIKRKGMAWLIAELTRWQASV
jgi:hypothetical protein